MDLRPELAEVEYELWIVDWNGVNHILWIGVDHELNWTVNLTVH